MNGVKKYILTRKINMKSTHKSEVIGITLSKLDGSDNLSLVSIFDGGYVCVLRTEDWVGKEKAIYVPPDSLVPINRPEFSFLEGEKRLLEVDGKKYARIKAKKIRGVVSFGMCVPCPDEAQVGEDWADRLGILHYDEEIHSSKKEKGINMTGGEVESPPNCHYIKYDVDSLRRYKHLLNEGEPCWVSEKLHGSSSKFVFNNDKMYCGSRGEWKREYATKPDYSIIEQQLRAKLTGKITEEEIAQKLTEIKNKLDNWKPSQNMWWKIYRKYPGIDKFCTNNPNYVLYGEAIGCQDLKYFVKPGEVGFAAFDILKPDGKFMDVEDFLETCSEYNIPIVPTVAFTDFNFDKICEMSEGSSLILNNGISCHVREGIVVKPLIERWDNKIGRVCFKVVGAGYLERV